jgi:hypothetical protein
MDMLSIFPNAPWRPMAGDLTLLNWLLEIVGAASIVPAALLNLRHPRPDAPRGAYSTERTL